MIDIKKQVAYRRDGSDEDFEVANELVDLGRIRQGLFFAHLALEKMLKAHVCRETKSLAPKIHNLVRLAELANLSTSTSQRTALGRFNQYQLRGRYPDTLKDTISQHKAKVVLQEMEQMLQWLKRQF